MEFQKYYSLMDNKEHENKSLPLIGKLIIEGEFDSSDCNFYPNHEVFGRSQGGTFPLYGKMNFEHDPKTGKIMYGYFYSAHASVPGVSHDGKEGYHYPFYLYDYEIKKYLGEGAPFKGTKARIVLDKPFFINQNGRLDGYDMAWLNR